MSTLKGRMHSLYLETAKHREREAEGAEGL